MPGLYGSSSEEVHVLYNFAILSFFYYKNWKLGKIMSNITDPNFQISGEFFNIVL